jgi:hypothetical protein
VNDAISSKNDADAGPAILSTSPEVRVGIDDDLPVAMHRKPRMSKHVETVSFVRSDRAVDLLTALSNKRLQYTSTRSAGLDLLCLQAPSSRLYE